MFASTSLADLDESVVSQTSVRIFGYGLNMGSELERNLLKKAGRRLLHVDQEKNCLFL
jgi:hypothetical protein